MQLNERQTELLAHYFTDASKILLATAVIGFFIPPESGPIAKWIFLMGLGMAVASLGFGVYLKK